MCNSKKLLLYIKEYAHPIRIIGGGVLIPTALILAFFWAAGYKLDAAAYIFQLLASILLALPSVASYFLGSKPIREMSFEEIQKFIPTTSPKKDWHTISRNDITECFLNIDPRLRFRMRYAEDGIQRDNFVEPWANNHPDPRATGYWCDLSYNGDFLDRLVLVSVDGGRANIPLPDRKSIIKKYDYHVAKIFDQHDSLDDYIKRSGLTVK